VTVSFLNFMAWRPAKCPLSLLYRTYPGVKLAAQPHLVPRSRMVQLYLLSPIRLHSTVLKLIRHRNTFTFLWYKYSELYDVRHWRAVNPRLLGRKLRFGQETLCFIIRGVFRECPERFLKQIYLSGLSLLNIIPLKIVPLRSNAPVHSCPAFALRQPSAE
jgi:hypothetical protein